MGVLLPFTVFGPPSLKRFTLSYQTVVLSVLSVTFVYCGQMVGRIKMKLGMQVGLGPSHTVLDGDPAPPTERGTAAPTFEIYWRRLCLHPYNLQCMSVVATKIF